MPHDRRQFLLSGPAPTAVNDEAAPTMAARAYAEIRHRILCLALAPGSTVSEKSLMEATEAGRTPVREALLRLAAEKLVLFRPNHSIQIAPIGFEEVRELFEARLQAERLAWQLWHARRTPTDIETLGHCFESTERLVAENRCSEVMRLDFEFHALPARHAGNRYLAQHLGIINDHGFRLWYLSTDQSPTAMRDVARAHDRIVQAFRNDDPAALDRAVVHHVNEAFEYVMEQMRGRGFDAARRLPMMGLRNDAAR